MRGTLQAWVRFVFKTALILGPYGCVSTPYWGKGQPMPANDLRYVHSGKASYYAHSFTNQTTAAGETYQPQLFTAAHKTLPFGTILMVRNSRNGRFVLVRVNDRGPFRKNRVVDLSFEAAKRLGMIELGLVPVDVYVVKKSSTLYKIL